MKPFYPRMTPKVRRLLMLISLRPPKQIEIINGDRTLAQKLLWDGWIKITHDDDETRLQLTADGRAWLQRDISERQIENTACTTRSP